MAGIPKEHESFYFDKLIRVQKLESVLSLIHATYRAKKQDLASEYEEKIEIAKRLKDAYNLFRDDPKGQDTGAGSYEGDIDQFESQYTIGHEMCIWKDKTLDLNDKAIEVAENKITIRDYFDVFFYNYFQPVAGTAVHPLYNILTYLKDNDLNRVHKENLPSILGVPIKSEIINGLCNFLDGTNYLRYVESHLVLSDTSDLDALIKKCNIAYIGKEGLNQAKIDLDTDDKYADYIMTNPEQDQEVSVIEIEQYSINELAKMLRESYDLSDDKATSIHLFGIKFGHLIRHEPYSVKEIINLSGLKESYVAELNKGIKLSKFVKEKSDKDIIKIIREDNKVETIPRERLPRENKVNPLNVILYGAPGTGKTYSTIEYALSIIDNVKPTFAKVSKEERKNMVERFGELCKIGRITFTTFHQSYGYEDFVQGLRPNQDVTLSFDFVDGVFKKISDRAYEDPNNDYVLIIDEINRGNISKIFGELITLLEDDKRYGEINQLKVILPSGESFTVPNNLYIVGTMNSADKSISLIDTALRRRFNFVEKAPNATMIENAALKEVFTEINSFLKQELRSTDLLIGHSYFMDKNEQDLVEILNTAIIPLLYEYFYDDEDRVKRALDCTKKFGLYLSSTHSGRLRLDKLGD